MRKMYFIFMLCALLIITAACGKKEVSPRAIDEKNDKCAQCNMAVMDNQFATQLILKNGKTFVFDDIGCMYKWKSENKNENIEAEFVRDYHSKEWVESDKATYVYDQSIRTPMAYNVISFQDKKDAEAFISKNSGKILNFDQLQDHKWKMNKEMMEKNMQAGHTDMNGDHSHMDEGNDHSHE
ncbi:nitrous oxide reductase accessory protein NosL [Aeribacillus composti]|jgi:copper chaperone NosL|uniref:nitrous oxide reductase accessory protein NosL n=1 Tax=Aeribacillus composti TaxID=1868734 RepID=UPI002E21B2AE|nr:nitrous oxide reductase accessory protein NosL [Aeribacillus composti]